MSKAEVAMVAASPTGAAWAVEVESAAASTVTGHAKVAADKDARSQPAAEQVRGEDLDADHGRGCSMRLMPGY